MIWIGVLGSAANTGLNLWVVLLGPVGRAALLSYAMPFWVLLVSWPLLHERPTRLQWIATFTAVAGIGLIVYDSASSHNGLAAALAVLSGITWAGGTVLSRQILIREKCDLLALTTWQMLVGGIVMEACALLVPGRPTDFTPSFLLLLLYELLPATVVGWLLWFLLLRKVEASVASLAILATPIIGLAFSMLEMGERPAWVEALGMGLMVLALSLVGPLALRQVRREPPGASSL